MATKKKARQASAISSPSPVIVPLSESEPLAVSSVSLDDVTSPSDPRLQAALEAQMRGELDTALALYQELLVESVTSGRATLLTNMGSLLRKQGKTKEAIAVYEEAVILPDVNAATWFNLGNARYDQKEWESALTAFNQASVLDPKMEAPLLQSARCLAELNRLPEASTRFAEALRLNAKNFSAWLECGNVCRRLSQHECARQCYEQAVQADPSRWTGHLALTRQLEHIGRHNQAAVHYHRAIVCAGGNARDLLEIHRSIGRYRLEQGDAARALEAMRQGSLTMRLAKDKFSLDEQAELRIDLGDALLRVGLSEDAHRVLEKASQAEGEAPLVRLAELSFRYNLWQEAVDVLRRNVALRPDSAHAHYNLAHMLAESWQMEEALVELARSEAIAPMPGAQSMRAAIAGKTGDADTALALYKGLADEPYGGAMMSSAAMSSLYSDTLSPQQVADLHREMFSPLGKEARAATSFSNAKDPKRKLKIGYVSADFHHQHPVNIFMQPILARHDAQQFEVFIYFVGVSYDEQTTLAQSRVEHWQEMTRASEAQLAAKIAADGIDILIDLAGHTSHQRMGVFGRRAAPVQASFLGYPGSTGVPNIDWIIADPIVAPVDQAALYSERVARLPHSVFCFSPETDYHYPEYADSVADRPLTFGSFNNVPKLTPHTIRLWSEVLKAVPKSRLILKAPSFKDASAINRYTRLFAELEISSERLEFRGPVGLNDMMAEYADVDIALDPVPYNGGTTSLQAMWMGVPVITRAGGSFVQRMGASFMTGAGMKDWVADNDADYINIAIRQAADRQALLQLKRGLRQHLLNQPAWNIAAYVSDFEAQLRSMWMDWCQQ